MRSFSFPKDDLCLVPDDIANEVNTDMLEGYMEERMAISRGNDPKPVEERVSILKVVVDPKCR